MGVKVLFSAIALISMLAFIFRIADKMRNENLTEEERNRAIRNNVIGMFASVIIACIFGLSAFM